MKKGFGVKITARPAGLLKFTLEGGCRRKKEKKNQRQKMKVQKSANERIWAPKGRRVWEGGCTDEGTAARGAHEIGIRILDAE